MISKSLNYRFALIVLCLIGCTGDFEEVNTNVNSPLSTTPNLLLTGLQRDMMTSLLNETWGIGNIVIQHTAKNQFVNEDRYLWGELNGMWTAVYDNMRDVNNIIIQAKETNETNYEGVGLIMKSWMFSLATDLYGDVPYSQAAQGQSGVLFPQYDSQEEIYNGILSDLAEANTLLADAGNISGDLIYQGDVKKWRKLANSLRLRYLMRISDRRDVSADMNAILNDPTNNPVFESNADHAVYTYQASSPDQFPLFSTRIGSFNEFRASKTLGDFLTSLDDPRLYIYFRPTPATEVTATTDDDKYDGIPNGLDDVIAQTYNGGQQYQARIGPLFYEQANTALGIQVAKGVIMTYAELQFILAEASEKGIINIGSAETFYANGINASFSYYGVDPAASYFTQNDVAYTGTTEEKLEKIGNQKWAASYFQGFEAWFDWRRTGYPVLAPAVDNQNDDRIPVRFIFPRIEQSLNATNREAAIARQGADDINTRVWWDANPN
jgi:hypothetical protein